jgi:hypothetical protein
MAQTSLFGEPAKQNKTYRAIRHDIVRKKQEKNDNSTHHPDLKINQINKVLNDNCLPKGITILELFAGRGNLTKVWEQYGSVEPYDKKYLQTGDSFLIFHELIAKKKKYDIIDIDPYGFPNRFFPDIYLLIDNGLLFLTMPKPYVNVLNGITQTHLISYFGNDNPSYNEIIERIVLWGLCHWRKVEVINKVECRSIWRLAFRVTRVKSTEYTGVKNR